MNAMILAAGLGTRLKPWTLSHPKALVPVGGVPMLERVIIRLREEGFDRIVVNVHHFASQVIDFLDTHDFGVEISVSDESACLLDTGGGIVKASHLVDFSHGPLLIHNVDILSNANLRELMAHHREMGAESTLLVSDRVSDRKLIWDERMELKGWHNSRSGEYRPSSLSVSPGWCELAFSGIHIMSEAAIGEMTAICRGDAFPVMDFYLSERRSCVTKGWESENLKLIDIGKPATLSQAQHIFSN